MELTQTLPRRSLLVAAGALALPLRAEGDPLAALRAGGVALIRHALAPGGGDPPGFTLADCSTQRNLSAEGRAQARSIGAMLREGDVVAGDVASSAWCRCQETATLLGLGTVRHDPALDSWFRRSPAEAEVAALVRLIASWQGPGARILVTHQVNITRVSGVFPASGEIVVLRPEGERFALVGRIATPA
jgi:phosphohistidine phosphatase SixA